MKKNRWITTRTRAVRPRLRLYCFPYAGRGASMYAGWQAAFSSDVEICPVQLPGREDRLGEPAACRIDPLVDSFVASVGEELDSPFVFFGHSMGGVVAYEIARRLQGSGARGPELLIVSASEPPHASRDATRVYELPDDELVAELRSWKGTPEQVLSDPALLHILLPIMRADIEMLDHYRVTPAGSQLTCPIVALGGTRDHDLKREELMRWRELTDDRFDLHMIEGDHFFINSNPPRMRAILTAELARVRPRRARVAALPVPAGSGA